MGVTSFLKKRRERKYAHDYIRNPVCGTLHVSVESIRWKTGSKSRSGGVLLVREDGIIYSALPKSSRYRFVLDIDEPRTGTSFRVEFVERKALSSRTKCSQAFDLQTSLSEEKRTTDDCESSLVKPLVFSTPFIDFSETIRQQDRSSNIKVRLPLQDNAGDILLHLSFEWDTTIELMFDIAPPIQPTAVIIVPSNSPLQKKAPPKSPIQENIATETHLFCSFPTTSDKTALSMALFNLEPIITSALKEDFCDSSLKQRTSSPLPSVLRRTRPKSHGVRRVRFAEPLVDEEWEV
eukprot:CAMPEP_0184366508 /NCGR_PEP_ID=MMETSP1089-20130417/154194_1 /TAXON_ID=38269 ORGANISM="Gloeochaete wittrockiana, Strain SAG46.84" /NCGR_SAMPLE_ID=MMETSP1089 /ASSEMBLY_ACC=CAM_ASM_000445 /LENGTH=292 /DNA_ID=CAMNT_0026708123 /DNA_START=18 /DNA_END=896 /DNA_ORIENTATION=-